MEKSGRQIYYLTAVAISVLLVCIFSVVGGINSCAKCAEFRKDMNRADDVVVVRFFESEDYEQSPVGSVRIKVGDSFTIPFTPTREGYVFAGWYDGSDDDSTLYADANGYSVVKVYEDILLYPKFTK